MTQDSLTALRAEVEAAFEEATIQLSHLIDSAAVLDVPSQERPVAETASALLDAEIVRAMTPPPPPPPPPGPIAPSNVWAAAMEVDEDPLDAFAPPPHMDWGPERHGLLRRTKH